MRLLVRLSQRATSCEEPPRDSILGTETLHEVPQCPASLADTPQGKKPTEDEAPGGTRSTSLPEPEPLGPHTTRHAASTEPRRPPSGSTGHRCTGVGFPTPRSCPQQAQLRARKCSRRTPSRTFSGSRVGNSPQRGAELLTHTPPQRWARHGGRSHAVPRSRRR